MEEERGVAQSRLVRCLGYIPMCIHTALIITVVTYVVASCVEAVVPSRFNYFL